MVVAVEITVHSMMFERLRLHGLVRSLNLEWAEHQLYELVQNRDLTRFERHPMFFYAITEDSDHVWSRLAVFLGLPFANLYSWRGPARCLACVIICAATFVADSANLFWDTRILVGTQNDGVLASAVSGLPRESTSGRADRANNAPLRTCRVFSVGSLARNFQRLVPSLLTERPNSPMPREW